MSPILRPIAGSLLLLLTSSPSIGAAAIPAPVNVSIDIVTAAMEVSAPSACRAWEGSQTAQKGEWWLTIGQARSAAPERTWIGAGSQIGCGSGSYGAAGRPSPSKAEAPYVIAGASVVAIFSRQIEDNPLLTVEIVLSVRKLAAFREGQEPLYQQSEIKRRFFFTHSREAFVPILLADAAESEAFGIHEVLAKVTVRMGDAPAPAYGSVSIASAAKGADVLLDGGVAGRTSDDGTVVLQNVRMGLREVGLRDPAGSETRKVVRVEARRTSLVNFGASDQDGPAVPYRLTPLGKNAQGYDEYRRHIDGAVVVGIPSGAFLMGNKETERSPLEHRVEVSAFLIDKTGVTWAQFKKFAEATGIPMPPHEPYWGTHDDHPAVFVTWDEARAYCSWAGARLPTEAEREKAARGTDARKYPWGNEEPDPRRGVFRRTWGYQATDPVGIHPDGASLYGVQDLGGNVWEWCSDWYDDGYYAVSPATDPKGPASGIAHVVRGGSWDSRPTVLSCSCRNWGHRGYREGDFGFRCAMNAPAER